MSALSEALSAIKSIILIEERVKSQGMKLEKLAELLVQVDRRWFASRRPSISRCAAPVKCEG